MKTWSFRSSGLIAVRLAVLAAAVLLATSGGSVLATDAAAAPKKKGSNVEQSQPRKQARRGRDGNPERLWSLYPLNPVQGKQRVPDEGERRSWRRPVAASTEASESAPPAQREDPLPSGSAVWILLLVGSIVLALLLLSIAMLPAGGLRAGLGTTVVSGRIVNVAEIAVAALVGVVLAFLVAYLT